METGPQLTLSSDRLVKPGIETAIPSLHLASGLSTTPQRLLWLRPWYSLLGNKETSHFYVTLRDQLLVFGTTEKGENRRYVDI